MTNNFNLEELKLLQDRILINNEWVKSSSVKTVDVYDPSTMRHLMKTADANKDDVYKAVSAARAAYPMWRDLDVNERLPFLLKLAEKVRSCEEELAWIDAIDSGNPITAMMGDAANAASYLEFHAYAAREIKGNTANVPGKGLNYTLWQPFGVVGRIIPYNHPIHFAVSKIAAALAAGNTIVLKPAHQTPLSAMRFGQLVQEVMPPGVVNIVTGMAESGSELVAHPNVHRISFTGSVGTAERILAQAGVKNVTLELGGKNPLMILPDVDLDAAAAAAVRGMNFSWCQGQSCGSTSRVFIHKSQSKELVDRIKEKVEKIRIGMPVDPQSEMGCIVSTEQFNKVNYFIDQGKKSARLIHGGGKPKATELSDGLFIEPTVFAGVTNDMEIAQEEIFGPVMSVLTWESETELLRLANDTRYGLTANIWTNDVKTAHRFARDVEAGYVWINGVGQRFQGAPFGGFKQSGIGRENSIEEIYSYMQLKNVNVSL
jgi:betaine-aldehyde dehydrogenase